MSDSGVSTALRLVACLAALLAIVGAPAALGSVRVVGGIAADVRSAPWTVVVVHGTLDSAAYCSGSIIDSLHVLTAGHCVFDSGGTLASTHTFLVRAGVTNAVTATSTDQRQDRGVAAIRVHPGYNDDPRIEADDVAVLTLTTPLDLSGPTAQAIALPTPGLRLKVGQAVSLTGFGITSANAGDDAPITLNRMSSTLIDDTSCLRAPDDLANAVLVCAFSGTNSPCHGDSGSALVLTTPTPVVVGVTGAGTCDANTAAEFADLTSPEILQFVQGNDDPPLAPRRTAEPVLSGPTTTPQVGQTLTCSPGAWTQTAAFAYGFLEGTNGLVLRSGPSSYRLGAGDAGRRILCRVSATSAGGTTEAVSLATAEVLNPPELAVPATRARAGGTAVLRATFVGWARPIGTVTVCATAAPSVAARTCRTAAIPASGRPSLALRLAVKPGARTRPARVAVTARSPDGRSASQAATVDVG